MVPVTAVFHYIMQCHTLVGRNIVRKQFAVLDELDNYSFNFVPGFDDNDIYPRKLMI